MHWISKVSTGARYFLQVGMGVYAVNDNLFRHTRTYLVFSNLKIFLLKIFRFWNLMRLFLVDQALYEMTLDLLNFHVSEVL